MTAGVIEEEKLRYASHSSLSTFRECQQRWHYKHVRGLRKIEGDDAAVERDFGSWWHMLKAADAIERGRAHGSLQWVPEKLTSVDGGPTLEVDMDAPLAALVMELAWRWWGQQSAAVHDLWTERIGEDLPERLGTLFTRWNACWAEQIKNERPLAVEMRWERRLPPVPQPESGLVDPKAMLVGYIDEIYKDVRRGLVVARDAKVSKALSAASSADDMMDSQLQLYAWGAAPIVAEWGVGPIRATQYDRARMVKPRTPVVTASGGLSKSVTDYDLATYLEWADGPDGGGVPWGEDGKFFSSGPRKGQPKYGLYQAEEKVIEALSTPKALSVWFQRSGPTPLNAHIIKAHLRAAVDTSLDMGRVYGRAEIEGFAPRNLTGGNCKWCDYAELCRSEMFGGAGGDFDPADFKLEAKKFNGR